MSEPLLVITGTTGSGKNRIAVEVAERIGAEICSLDSMKVYRGMDAGTAKPSAELLQRVPHHLIDVVEPNERMDLRRFLDLVEGVRRDAARRRRPLLLVGGTAMYLAGLLWGVHAGPSRDPDFRARLREEAREGGVPRLHARLAAIDPAAAQRIDPNDYRRIERALEIHAKTGAPPSASRGGWYGPPREPARIEIVTWPRETLRARIERRVDEMLASGWVDEVRRIHARGGFSPEASMALGYRQILDMLAGRLPPEQLAERIKTKTWQFARRQLTWMKKLPGRVTVRSNARSAAEEAERLAPELLDFWNSTRP